MRNIWTIFTRDIRKIRTNVIALIVVLGVTVVPCLYAWYNIAASWDPYGNTGNLKVAVASVDEGYIGNLIPLQLNLGDQVLSALRENTQLNWVFTTKSKAMKGVKSGEYYAAIVIPEDFSTNLMSVFSSDIKKPEITYYSNAKENAIAPKVTDKGATAVQTQVNKVFIETISDTVLTALQTVANTADSRDSDELAGTLITNLNKIGSDLSASSTTLHSFSQMTGFCAAASGHNCRVLKSNERTGFCKCRYSFRYTAVLLRDSGDSGRSYRRNQYCADLYQKLLRADVTDDRSGIPVAVTGCFFCCQHP